MDEHATRSRRRGYTPGTEAEARAAMDHDHQAAAGISVEQMAAVYELMLDFEHQNKSLTELCAMVKRPVTLPNLEIEVIA